MDVLQVGPAIYGDGLSKPMRGGKSGEGIVGQLHARYFEAGYRGALFSAANQAAQAVSVGLATTYTGLLLYNPLNSGKILVPSKLKFGLSVAPVGIGNIGLIQGYSGNGGVSAQTTKLTVQSSQIGNAVAGVGICLSAATIATPTWAFQLWDGFTAAALPAPQPPIDLDGIFQIYPGGFLAIGALTAITGLGAIVWEEVPQ